MTKEAHKKLKDANKHKLMKIALLTDHELQHTSPEKIHQWQRYSGPKT